MSSVTLLADGAQGDGPGGPSCPTVPTRRLPAQPASDHGHRGPEPELPGTPDPRIRERSDVVKTHQVREAPWGSTFKLSPLEDMLAPRCVHGTVCLRKGMTCLF